MKLPILSSLQWWIAGGILAAAIAGSGTAAYKIGVTVQAARDNAALREGIRAADARAAAAEQQRDDQAEQHRKETKERDRRDELATKLYNEAVAATNASNVALIAARKAIREQRNDPQTSAILDTAIPADLRRRVCDAKGEACN